MKTLSKIGIITLAVMLMAASFGRQDAISAIAGTSGIDKIVSDGTTVTFNKPISGFVVTGSQNIVVSLIVEYENDTVSAGYYNYLDNAIELEVGELYTFNNYVSKMTFTTGGKILVNYRK